MGGVLQQFDHKLIGQVGTKPVRGIRACVTGLIMPNHYSLRFRLTIPTYDTNLTRETLTTFSLDQSPIESEMSLWPTSIRF